MYVVFVCVAPLSVQEVIFKAICSLTAAHEFNLQGNII